MTHSLALQAELVGHTDRAWHVSWSPSSPTLASCSSDKSIRLYSFSPSSSPSSPSTPSSPTYRFSPKSTIPTSHNRTVRSLAFSPTGTTLATASFDATVGIWQQTTEAGVDDGEGEGGEGEEGEWEPVDPLEGHDSECKSAEWSADGRLLASCSRDKSVWIWEAVGPAEFECLAVLMNHTQDVKSLTWHPSEELLASASYDDTIKLFASDPYDDEWTCITTLLSHTATVWSVSFSPCGNYLASAGDDLVIKIWGRDPLGGTQAIVDEAGMAVREEGGRMGPWSGGGGVRIGQKEKWEWTLKGEIVGAHSRTIYSVDWAMGGVREEEAGMGRIVTGGGDGRINVFQITKPTSTSSPSTSPSPCPTHTLLTTLESAHGVSDINHVAWCRLSPSQAAAKLRKLEGGELDEEEEEEEAGRGEDEDDPRWRRARDMVASAGDDGVVKVWMVEEM